MVTVHAVNILSLFFLQRSPLSFEQVFDELFCFCETKFVCAACEFGGSQKITFFSQIEKPVFKTLEIICSFLSQVEGVEVNSTNNMHRADKK
jgi:hypothetical protein